MLGVRSIGTAARAIVVLGATASGKSELAVRIAEQMGGEIICADSMTVYRQLCAGVAKPDPLSVQRVRHHCLSHVDCWETYTVADWLVDACAAITDCQQRGVRPVIVGGTNLYIHALLHGFLAGPGAYEPLRRALAAMSLPALHASVQAVDPCSADRVGRSDRRRLERALEVFVATGVPLSAQRTQWVERSRDVASRSSSGAADWAPPGIAADPVLPMPDVLQPHIPAHLWRCGLRLEEERPEGLPGTASASPSPDRATVSVAAAEPAPGARRYSEAQRLAVLRALQPLPAVVLGLRWPDAALHMRINARVKRMFADTADRPGLVAETRTLLANGRLGKQAAAALGTRQVIEHLQGRRSLADTVEDVKIETRRFAKQQRTWLRRLAAVHWLDAAAAVHQAAADAGQSSLLAPAAARPPGSETAALVRAAECVDWVAVLAREAVRVVQQADVSPA